MWKKNRNLCYTINSKSQTSNHNVLYSALFGNFCQFLALVDTTLKFLYKPDKKFVICSYVNVDYLSNSDWRQQLSLLLRTYNMLHIVNFPTRFWNNKCRACDNIFVVNLRLNFCNLLSVANGLSSHDAQFLIFNTFFTRILRLWLTYSMEQSPSWEANWFCS